MVHQKYYLISSVFVNIHVKQIDEIIKRGNMFGIPSTKSSQCNGFKFCVLSAVIYNLPNISTIKINIKDSKKRIITLLSFFKLFKIQFILKNFCIKYIQYPQKNIHSK